MDRQEKFIEETMVGGQTVRLMHEDVPLDQIELDFANPRIKYKLALGGNGNGKPASEKELEKLILGLQDVRHLRRDIEHQGGLIEPIILQKNGNGKYKAKEGNCRLTCYKDLHRKDPNNPKWKTIRARILSDDVTAKQIAILLSGWHVAGKITWAAHEKAGHVYEMSQLGMSQDEIAIYHHSSKSTINRLLQAYGFMVDKFFKIDDGKYKSKGEGKWSYFDEFFKKKDLTAELKSNPNFGDQFCRWVGEETLPQPVDVRYLPVIMKHPTARKEFEEGMPLKDVKKLIEAEEPEQGSPFFTSLAKMKEAFTNAAQVREIIRIRTDPVAKKRMLDTYEAMVDFMTLADVPLPNRED